MKVRLWVVVLSLSFGFALARAALPATLRVQEATLHVSAPAEVVASVPVAGASVDFALPKGLLTDSMRATQGDKSLSPVLRPVSSPRKPGQTPLLERYQATLAGLSPGAPVKLRFRTRGLDWRPSTTLKVSGGRGRLEAQASITNNALDLTGARLRLMSGHVGEGSGFRSLFDDASDYESYLQALQDLGREAAAAQVGGIHLAAELTSPGLPVGTTRQVLLLSQEVSVTTSYRWDTSPVGAEADETSLRPQRAHALYSFANASSRPLPEGKVAVAEGGTAVGIGHAAWTPPGETALVAVGNVQGLSVRRGEDAKPDPKTWETRRSIKLQAENSRRATLTLRVVEHLRKRWEYSDDQAQPVYEFSQQPALGKKDTFVWDVTVPALGQAEVTYSYGNPMDLATLKILSFSTDNSLRERQYLVEEKQSRVSLPMYRDEPIRLLGEEGYVVYRLPIPANVKQADLVLGMGNAFRVSLASEAAGKPASYRVAADATAIAGRVVRDGGNWNTYTFDLAPFLAKSPAIYVRLDNPEGAEPFIKTVTVLRVPEGFPSRAPGYAVGDSALTSGPRKVLISFAPGTPAEEKYIQLNRATTLSGGMRVADFDKKIVYALPLPEGVNAADLTVRAGNTFVVAVAPDVGGRAGEFREEINIEKLYGRHIYLMDNDQDYGIDLTPYLRDNPARTVYVAVYAADPTTGWGAGLQKLEVAELDEAERARLERRRKAVETGVTSDRQSYRLSFRTNNREAEAPYLYQSAGTGLVAMARTVQGGAAAIYRIPLKPDNTGNQVVAWVLGDYAVSIAADEGGKPGKFTELANARQGDGVDAIARFNNMRDVIFDLPKSMAASGACYLKITDAAPDQTPEARIHEISLRRP